MFYSCLSLALRTILWFKRCTQVRVLLHSLFFGVVEVCAASNETEPVVVDPGKLDEKIKKQKGCTICT